MVPEIENLKEFVGMPCQVYATSRLITNFEHAEILQNLKCFFPNWESHGLNLIGGAAILQGRFLVVSHKPHEISGCSRDALLFQVQELGKKLGFEWVGGARIFYRNGQNEIVDVDRLTFKSRALSGQIGADTEVFDTTVRLTDSIIQGRFSLPVAKSWHNRLLEPIPVSV